MIKKYVHLLFYEHDGHKESLNKKRLRLIGGSCVGLLILWQLVSGETPEETRSSGPIASAQAPTEQPIVLPIAAEMPKSQQEGRARGGPTLTAPQVIARPRDLKTIPPGSFVKAVLASGASNGMVKARLSEGLTINGETILEEGTTLVGTGSSTEERLFVAFSQAVFRDGTFGQVQAQACDASDQIVGLKGSKVGNKALQIAGSIGLGFVGGMSEGLQDTQGQQGAVVRPPTVKNALLHATAATALEQSQNMMSELKNRIPIIEVSQGKEICVMFGVPQ